MSELEEVVALALERLREEQDEEAGAHQTRHALNYLALHPHTRHAPGVGWYEPDQHGVWQHLHEDEILFRLSEMPGGPKNNRPIVDTGKVLSRRREVRIDINDFDANPDVLAVGGMLHRLDGREAPRPISPDDMITKHCHPTYRPGGPQTEWLATLARCFPSNPDIVEFLQRLVGYGVTGHNKEQCFVVMVGGGANGKTTVIKALTRVIGAVTRSIPITVLMSRSRNENGEGASPQLMQLMGARLVWADEPAREARLDESKIKILTGGDAVTARQLYGPPVTFTPQALIVVTSNHLPVIHDTDEGIWRRIRVIPWEVSFRDSPDTGIDEKLAAEADGIMEWILDGARKWYQDGLHMPPAVEAKTVGYREEQDGLNGFLGNILLADEDAFMPLGDVYDAYLDWARSEGTPEQQAWKNRTVFRALRERGVEQEQRRHGPDQVVLKGMLLRRG